MRLAIKSSSDSSPAESRTSPSVKPACKRFPRVDSADREKRRGLTGVHCLANGGHDSLPCDSECMPSLALVDHLGKFDSPVSGGM